MTHPINWKSRLMVALPCAELAYTVFWQKLLTLQYIGWHIDRGHLVTLSGAYIQDSHHKLVEEFLKSDADRLLFLEHDHGFPAEVLELHGEQTEAIVSGLYYARSVVEPHPVIYNWDDERTSIKPLQPYEMFPILNEPGLHKVDVVPMGCVSIRRDVFEKWPEMYPWYAVPSGRRAGGILGDDVWFCRHAQDQGYDIYVDSRIKVDHYALVPINESVYLRWVEELKKKGHAVVRKEDDGKAEGLGIEAPNGSIRIRMDPIRRTRGGGPDSIGHRERSRTPA